LVGAVVVVVVVVDDNDADEVKLVDLSRCSSISLLL
jgi:hypothetical protein